MGCYWISVSIEDAHRHNDLDLFDKFKNTTIILGVVAIANSKVESVEEIKTRVEEVLKHIPKERYGRYYFNDGIFYVDLVLSVI